MLDRHNNFDLIRLLAAAQVVYVHAARDLKLATPAAVDWLAVMFPGVVVFFVISGFLVTKSLVSGGGALWPYAVKRVLRIYPALWANFIVVLMMVYWSGALAPAELPTWKFVFYQLGQFVIGAEPYGRAIAGPIYHWGDFYTGYPNPALWTIPVELGFYVLVPLVFCALVRRSIAIINAVILIGMAVSLAMAVLSAHLLRTAPHSIVTGGVGNGPLPYFWIFLLGAGAYSQLAATAAALRWTVPALVRGISPRRMGQREIWLGRRRFRADFRARRRQGGVLGRLRAGLGAQLCRPGAGAPG